MHLVIDGYGGDSDSLANEELIYQFLGDYPDRIGMTRISPPQVYTYRGKKPGDWGLSGFVLIAESHITVHTFPGRGYLNVDIFSCKQFDAPAALAAVKRMFGLSEADSCLLDREGAGVYRRQGDVFGHGAGADGSSRNRSQRRVAQPCRDPNINGRRSWTPRPKSTFTRLRGSW